MAAPNSIDKHKDSALIIEAIANGVPGAEIARRWAVSESAVSRYRSNRMDAIRSIVTTDDDAPDVSDVIGRLLDLADSARTSRRLADASSSPAVRARVATAELSVLDRLINRLGVDDIAVARLAESTGVLVRALRDFADAHPEIVPDLLRVMGEHEELLDLRDALKARAKGRTND